MQAVRCLCDVLFGIPLTAFTTIGWLDIQPCVEKKIAKTTVVPFFLQRFSDMMIPAVREEAAAGAQRIGGKEIIWEKH